MRRCWWSVTAATVSLLTSVADGAVANNLIPRATGSRPTVTEEAAPEVTALQRRVCVDTVFTGDLIGYYYNPSCGGFDEYRCLPNEEKTRSGSFFNCARSDSASPWATLCRARTIFLDDGNSVACFNGCNTVLWFTEASKPPFISYTCGNGGTTQLYANSDEVPQLSATRETTTTSSTGSEETSATSATESSRTQNGRPASASESPTDVSGDGNGGNPKSLGAIIGGAVGGAAVLVLAVGIGLFFFYKRKGDKKKKASVGNASLEEKPELAGGSSSPTSPYHVGGNQPGLIPVPAGHSEGMMPRGELDGRKVGPVDGVSELNATAYQASLPTELPHESRPHELDGSQWAGGQAQQWR